jgi:NTP pyrophosphatase (non-canonical NTP hydrolase)
VDLVTFQELMARTYGERDTERGRAATVAWLAEETGELARAVRKGNPDQQLHELGDVLAWLASLANQLGLSLDDAAARYADGCPVCGSAPCTCPPSGDQATAV